MKSKGKHHRSLSVGPLDPVSASASMPIDGPTTTCCLEAHYPPSLSTELEELCLQQLEHRYGGHHCANVSARVIQQAFRAHYFKQRFQNLRLSMLLQDGADSDPGQEVTMTSQRPQALTLDETSLRATLKESNCSNVRPEDVDGLSELEELSPPVVTLDGDSPLLSEQPSTPTEHEDEDVGPSELKEALLASSYYRLDSHVEDASPQIDEDVDSSKLCTDSLPPAMHLLSSPLRRITPVCCQAAMVDENVFVPEVVPSVHLHPSAVLPRGEAGCRDSGVSYTSTSTTSSSIGSAHEGVVPPAVPPHRTPVSGDSAQQRTSTSLDSGVDDASPSECCLPSLRHCSCHPSTTTLVLNGPEPPTPCQHQHHHHHNHLPPATCRRHTAPHVEPGKLPEGEEVAYHSHHNNSSSSTSNSSTLVKSTTPGTHHPPVVNAHVQQQHQSVLMPVPGSCLAGHEAVVSRTRHGFTSPVWKRKCSLVEGGMAYVAVTPHTCCHPPPHPHPQKTPVVPTAVVPPPPQHHHHPTPCPHGQIPAIRPEHNSASQKSHRKRLYRIGLNLFNKKPYQGMEFLVAQRFVEDSSTEIAYFLHTRKGLSRQMVGEFLGDKKCEAVLDAYCNLIDFRGLIIDEALRKFNFYFLLSGESDRILRITEHFSQAYWRQNSEWLRGTASIHSSEALLLLIYSILMLNTDLNSGKIKHNRRMKLKEFIKNLKGLNGGRDFDTKVLTGIYQRVSQTAFQVGEDHTTQVKQISEVLLPEGTLCYPPHRRLVCLCKMHECVMSGSNAANSYLQVHHQLRYVFLFNDLIVVASRVAPVTSEAPVGGGAAPTAGLQRKTSAPNSCAGTDGDGQGQVFATPFFACVGGASGVSSGGTGTQGQTSRKSPTTPVAGNGSTRGVRYAVVHMASLAGVKAHLLYRGEQLYAVQLRQSVSHQALLTLRAISSSDFIHFLDDLRECLLETNEMDVMRVSGQLNISLAAGQAWKQHGESNKQSQSSATSSSSTPSSQVQLKSDHRRC